MHIEVGRGKHTKKYGNPENENERPKETTQKRERDHAKRVRSQKKEKPTPKETPLKRPQ